MALTSIFLNGGGKYTGLLDCTYPLGYFGDTIGTVIAEADHLHMLVARGRKSRKRSRGGTYIYKHKGVHNARELASLPPNNFTLYTSLNKP